MIEFRVEPYAGDAFEVTADSRDIYVWEKKQRKGKTFQALMRDLAMVDLYTIAWLAARRVGQFDGTEAEFAETCVLDFDVNEEPDPTPPAASEGRLSPWQ